MSALDELRERTRAYDDVVRETVQAAPPLARAQHDRLAGLLRTEATP